MKTWLSSRPVVRYLTTGFLVLASLGLRVLILPHAVGMPFLTFLPAILAIIWFCGRGPALASLAFSALLADRFLLPGQNHLVFPWTSGAVGLVAFGIYGLVMILTLDALIRANDGMRRALGECDQLLQSLEQRVAERTAELREEMSGRREAEARVAQYARLDALGQLLGGVSHDFNNLLSIIAGNLNLAQRRLAKGDVSIVPHIDAALDGARKGADLTGRLLAFARKQPLRPSVTDVNGLIRAMVDMLGTTLGEHIRIDLQLDKDLWRTEVDPGQLENAILNLAVNARDAMPSGGRLSISTGNAEVDQSNATDATPPGTYVAIIVTDDGAGMSDEVRARAFEPFFTTKEVGHGTGLGLSQIHGLIRQSGGHVALSSKPGVGTSVTLYLPRHDGAAAVPSAPRDRSHLRTVPSPRRVVLVVEDDNGVRAVTAEMLVDLNCRVLQAICGTEALALLHDNPEVSLLLTDVVMPEMLGSELAEKALQARSDLRVLYTSGYALETALKTGQLPPDAHLLPKPFTPEQLSDAMATVFASAELRDAALS